ncbi:ParB/RepB/Spo0J family partition protein [Streptomyces minutiscleroticus]|uniref:ParB/RepB/Spo0J family partition protein n=1 Tax=Streptomyces minutiscleroticus TaxID=68238 RepID=UPI00331A9D14
MSKADQLGAGRFGAAARPVSARRAAIGAATGVPTEGVAPPTRLPVMRISPNPDNPRTTLGDLSELAGSLKEHGQKQAITVMNRDAYLKANPEREAELEADTTHVVVDGSSRLAAAREAGLSHLNVMVDDDQGDDGDAILESALVANVHRQDLQPLDEARALQRLLAIHGSQSKLAKRLHKSQGWVSQRLTLLNLTPELQQRIGQEPIDLLRAVGNKPQEEQQPALEELKAQRARQEAERQERKQAKAAKPQEPAEREPAEKAQPTATPYYDVIREDTAQQHENDAAEAESDDKPIENTAPPAPEQQKVQKTGVQETGVQKTEVQKVSEPAAPHSETVPEPRSDSTTSSAAAVETGSRTLPKLPYDDGAFLAMHLIRKMNDVEFDKMLTILIEHQNKRAASSTTDA